MSIKISKAQREAGTVFCGTYYIHARHPSTYSDPEECISMRELYNTKLRELENPPKLGDIIEFLTTDPDNDEINEIYMWTGNRLMDLNTDLSEYGNLPDMFRVLEETTGEDDSVAKFPLVYWHDLYNKGLGGIQNNYFVWFDHSKVREQLLSNMDYDTKINGKFVLYSKFEHEENGVMKDFYIAVEHDICNDKISSIWDEDKKIKMERLVAEGVPENNALLSMGYDPFKYNRTTGKLADKYLQEIQDEFIKKIKSEELIPSTLRNLSCSSPNDKDMTGSVLWWYLDGEVYDD